LNREASFLTRSKDRVGGRSKTSGRSAVSGEASQPEEWSSETSDASDSDKRGVKVRR